MPGLSGLPRAGPTILDSLFQHPARCHVGSYVCAASDYDGSLFSSYELVFRALAGICVSQNHNRCETVTGPQSRSGLADPKTARVPNNNRHRLGGFHNTGRHRCTVMNVSEIGNGHPPIARAKFPQVGAMARVDMNIKGIFSPHRIDRCEYAAISVYERQKLHDLGVKFLGVSEDCFPIQFFHFPKLA